MKSFIFVSLAIVVFTALTAAEECSQVCTRIYAPICATDGVNQRTFDNACLLNVYNCLNPARPYKEVKVGECDDANKPIPI